MNGPLYGQADAGALWNRTFTHFVTKGNQTRTDTSSTHAAEIVAGAASEVTDRGLGSETPGLLYSRCPHDPCVFNRKVAEDNSNVTMPIYVDDRRVHYDPTEHAERAANADMDYESTEDYFLGANRFSSTNRDVITLRATTYTKSMVERYWVLQR